MKSWLKSTLTFCTLLLFDFQPASGWLLRDYHYCQVLPPEYVFDGESFPLGLWEDVIMAQQYQHLIPRPYETDACLCPICGELVTHHEPPDVSFPGEPFEHRRVDERWCYEERCKNFCVGSCDDTDDYYYELVYIEEKCWYYYYFHKETHSLFPYFLEYLKFCSDLPNCKLLWPELGGLAEDINDLVYTAFDRCCTHLYSIQRFSLGWSTAYDDYASCAVTYLFFYSQYREVILSALKYYNIQRDSDPEYSAEYNKAIKYFRRALDLISPKFLKLYTDCIAQFPHPRLYYERMLVASQSGHNLEALADFEQLADLENSDFLSPEMLVEGGRLYNESLQFAKSIASLTEVIKQDPNNREAYLERAYAYFETGDFAKAIEDYRVASPVLERIALTDHLLFAGGLISGIAQGGAEGLVEFVPSTLSTLKGMGCGLWALAWHPVDVSKQFVQATFSCVDYLCRSTPKEMLSKLAPEVALLIEEWDTLSFQERGHLVGRCVGKYGVDILCGYGVASGVKVARELKRANSLMTLEACASSAEKSAVVTQAALRHANHRQTVLSSANLKIHQGRQGKHIKGHNNYDPKRSVLTHKDPQHLVDKHAGTGRPISGTPGKPGYKERIDFGEIIGDYVDRDSRKAYPSTVGVIHYSQDGVHIHPLRPVGICE